MTNFYRIWQLLVGLLLLCGAFSSCQRASYSFQQPGSVPEAGGVPLPVTADSTSAMPVPTVIRAINTPQRHPSEARKSNFRLANLVKQSIVGAGRLRLQAARPVAARLRQALPPHPAHTYGAALAPPPSKAVAVLLAVLLGIFGAHLFYLGYRKRAFGYLAATLLCALLIVLLLAALPVASLSTGFAVLFLVSLAVIGVAIVYACALLDAIRILLNGPDTLG